MIDPWKCPLANWGHPLGPEGAAVPFLGDKLKLRDHRASASTHFLRGSIFFVPHTPAALTTSSHTFTNSLYRARDSCLRRFLLSTGWRGWRWQGGLPRWPWELNFHSWLMVLSLCRLEWALAALFDGPRASLRWFVYVYGLPLVAHGSWRGGMG